MQVIARKNKIRKRGQDKEEITRDRQGKYERDREREKRE